jgi:hypothetical protein
MVRKLLYLAREHRCGTPFSHYVNFIRLLRLHERS